MFTLFSSYRPGGRRIESLHGSHAAAALCCIFIGACSGPTGHPGLPSTAEARDSLWIILAKVVHVSKVDECQAVVVDERAAQVCRICGIGIAVYDDRNEGPITAPLWLGRIEARATFARALSHTWRDIVPNSGTGVWTIIRDTLVWEVTDEVSVSPEDLGLTTDPAFPNIVGHMRHGQFEPSLMSDLPKVIWPNGAAPIAERFLPQMGGCEISKL